MKNAQEELADNPAMMFKTSAASSHGPDHYRSSVEPWDAMESWLTPEEFRGFLKGNAIKYLARANKKGEHDKDLAKAKHYQEKLAECVDKATSESKPKARETVLKCLSCGYYQADVLAPGHEGGQFWHHCDHCKGTKPFEVA